MKEVYILTQNWQIPERSSINDVCAVYASREDAVNRLRELYEEDVNWLLEAKNVTLKNLMNIFMKKNILM